MTINTTSISTGPYSGNGVTTTFAYNFKVQLSSEIVVTETDSGGTETVLTEGTHYSVTGVGDNGGGTVVRASALPSGYTWLIERQTEKTQEADFPGQGSFSPVAHENAFDKLTAIIQEINATSLNVGSAATRANQMLSFDSAGDAETNISASDVRNVIAGALTAGTAMTSEVFTGTGSQTAFVLGITPVSATALVVTIDGVAQTATTDYTLSGSTVTFTTAPPNNASVVVRNFGNTANQSGYVFPQTAAEIAVGVSPSDEFYPEGDIRRYGADTSSTDNTTALQNAININAHGGSPVFIPNETGARYRFASTVYGYYDVTNNPNFPSGLRQDGRIVINGEAAPNKDNFTNNEYRGSIIEYTGTTGIGLDLYDSSGTEAKAVVLRNFGLYANTSGFPIQMDRIPQVSIVDNVFIGNDGVGGGIKIDTWASSLRDVWVYGNGSGSGIAFDTSDGGGNVLWHNVNAENFDVGFDFGAAYDPTRGAAHFIWNHILHSCQSKTNRIGYQIRAGVGALTLLDCWSEANTERAVAMSNMAGWADNADEVLGDYANLGLIKIIGGYFADTAGSGFIGIEIGDDTGTETTDGVGNVLIDGLVFGQITSASDAIRIHNSTNAGYRTIDNLVCHNNGGQLIVIDAEAQYGCLNVRNIWTDGVTEVNVIEDVGSANAAMYMARNDNLVPTFAANTTYNLGNATRLPDKFAVTTLGGATTITLPSAPEEGHYVMMKTNGTPTLTLARNGQNINGAGADFTTTNTWQIFHISWVRNYGWIVT